MAPTSEDRILRVFIENVALVQRVLAAHFATALTQSGFRLLLETVRIGGLPRSGTIDSIGYDVHGAGCRFTVVPTGVVDVDVDPASGLPTWDAWRLVEFAKSIGVPLDEASAAAALDRAVVEHRL